MALRPRWLDLMPPLVVSADVLGRFVRSLNRQIQAFFDELPNAEHRARSRIVVAADTLVIEDDVVVFTPGGYAFTLPRAEPLAGREFVFKLWSGGAVTLTPTTPDLIDNAATYSLAAPRDCVRLLAGLTGTSTYGWLIVGNS